MAEIPMKLYFIYEICLCYLQIQSLKLLKFMPRMNGALVQFCAIWHFIWIGPICLVSSGSIFGTIEEGERHKNGGPDQKCLQSIGTRYFGSQWYCSKTKVTLVSINFLAKISIFSALISRCGFLDALASFKSWWWSLTEVVRSLTEVSDIFHSQHRQYNQYCQYNQYSWYSQYSHNGHILVKL